MCSLVCYIYMFQAEYKFIYLDQWCKTQWKYLKEKYRREKKS